MLTTSAASRLNYSDSSRWGGFTLPSFIKTERTRRPYVSVNRRPPPPHLRSRLLHQPATSRFLANGKFFPPLQSRAICKHRHNPSVNNAGGICSCNSAHRPEWDRSRILHTRDSEASPPSSLISGRVLNYTGTPYKLFSSLGTL